jgi:DNA-binding NarL/FixJ family response regulator
METQPTGRTVTTITEKQIILDMRLRGYSIRQIAEYTERGETTVKRIIYNWPKQTGRRRV